MSEQQSTESTTTKDTEQSAKPSDVAEQLGENGQKALKAERDARKAAEKALSDLNAQLDQMKQAQMSDLEKAQAQARSFEEAAASAKSEALRWRVAAKHGISDEDAETFLTGNDEASLTRQAERLAALSATTAAPTTPKPDLSQGGSAGTPRPQTAAEKFAAAFEGRV